MNRSNTLDRNFLDNMFASLDAKGTATARGNRRGGRPPLDENGNEIAKADGQSDLINTSVLDSILGDALKKPVVDERDEQDYQPVHLPPVANVSTFDSILSSLPGFGSAPVQPIEHQLDAVENTVYTELESLVPQQDTSLTTGKGTKTMFFVMFDSDFHRRYDIGAADYVPKTASNDPSARKLGANDHRIPLVDNLAIAQKVAQKLCTHAREKGTTSGNKYPIFGAIILGIQIDMNNIKTKDGDEIAKHGGANWGLLDGLKGLMGNAEIDLITYRVNDTMRALITKNALQRLDDKNSPVRLVSASYGYRLVDKNNVQMPMIPVHTGFAILNMSGMPSEDIAILRKVYDKQSGYCSLGNESAGTNSKDRKTYTDCVRKHQQVKLPQEAIPEMQPQESMQNELVGGNWEQKYRSEKKKYLQLQKIAKDRGLL